MPLKQFEISNLQRIMQSSREVSQTLLEKAGKQGRRVTTALLGEKPAPIQTSEAIKQQALKAYQALKQALSGSQDQAIHHKKLK